MRIIDQTLDDVTASLSPLDVEWMDDLAANAIAEPFRHAQESGLRPQ